MTSVLIFVSITLLWLDTIWNWVAKPAGRTAIKRVDQQIVAQITEKEKNQLLNEARKLSDSGRYEDALSLYLKYQTRDPLNPEAHFYTGATYLSLGRIQAAYYELRQATKLRPDYAEAQEKLGEIFLLTRHNKEAGDIARLLSKDDKTQAEGLILESAIAMAEGNLNLAIQKAGKAIGNSASPPSVKSLSYLVALYLKTGEKVKAEEALRRIDPNSLNASDYIRLAKVFLGAGEETKALAFFREALGRFPAHPEVNYNYGQYLFSKGNTRDAAAYYEKALAVIPNSEIMSYRLAHALMASGRMDEAGAKINAMIIKNPKSLLALTISAQHHFMTGNRGKSIANLNQIAGIMPNNSRPYVLLSEIYWVDGNLSMAKNNAQKALGRGESTASPHIILADVYMRTGQSEKALSHCEKALAIDPANPSVLVQSGDLYMKLGQAKKAKDQFTKAATRLPSNSFIQNKIALAEAFAGDPGQALKVSQKNLAQSPNDLGAITAYVDALVLNKRVDDALSFVTGYLKKRPDRWRVSMIQGDLLALKGKPDAAGQSYRQALKNNPDDLNMLFNMVARYQQMGFVREADTLLYERRNKFSRNLLYANQLAWMYIERWNEPQRATGLINMLEKDGEGSNFKDTVGWYYYKTGDMKRAEHYLHAAKILDPENVTIRGHLALTLLRTGRTKDTEAEARKVVAMLPQGALRTEIETVLR